MMYHIYGTHPHAPPQSANSSMRVIRGVGELAKSYDTFVLDQYGVLHNGTVAYEGAVDCFNRLLALGKTVVILSNTSRRAVGIARKLSTFGFDSSFLGSVTGGEAAWKYLDARRSELQRCALMTTDLQENVVLRATNPESLFYGLDVEVVDVERAQFLLVEGTKQLCYSDKLEDIDAVDFYSTGQSNDRIQRFLQRGIERQLPMLCTNPDFVSFLADNRVAHMGGKIAHMYEEMGGRVVYFGKPLREHFEACIEMAGATQTRARVVHVGDSMHHDIQGASNTGIDSLLIGVGVHAEALGIAKPGDQLTPEAVAQLSQTYHVEPTYATPYFTW